LSLEEYEKISITQFMGLYARGLADDCPPDHSPACQNVRFNRKGEVQTRDGSAISFNIGTPVKRMFAATFDHGIIIMLTCDGAGNIYRQDTGAVLLNVPNMVDFAAINVFSFCLISPILDGGLSSVYIWNPDTVPIRKAAGLPPGSSFSAAESATIGNCDIGVHQFAVSFITNSGYTTQPGPLITGSFVSVTATSTGGFSIDLTGIPLGPAGTVARQIFATQADQDLFFFVPFNGLINDNTTTSLTVNFFDTDLAVSADALFDLLPVIPGGTFGLAGGMSFYHGRVFYFGGEFCLIRATNAGDCESIDNVSGFIQIPDQFDGNIVRGTCTLQDIIYFTKAVGIFSVTDNGDVPSSWQIISVDAGVGSASQGMGTITLSQSALSQNQIILMADFGGLYSFTGSVQQPPLTWKINDLWNTLVLTTNITTTLNVAIDPYNKIIYICSAGIALIAGDYNDGLDSQNIKWTQYAFPFTPDSIGMLFIQDLSDMEYRLRIGSGNNIYKLNPGAVQDSGVAINSFYATYFLSPSLGALNIFRFIRFRATFPGTLNLLLSAQDNAFTLAPVAFTGGSIPGRDNTRETNFMDEKCSVQVGCNEGSDTFLLQRLDVFSKPRFNMRPSV
jgi:hypothetical protein